MKYINILLFFFSISFFSCSKGPKPIVYGKDECAFCKMTVMDKRFGCQIVNSKGKHFNFDDLSCLAGYLETGVIAGDQIGGTYIPDYTGSDALLPAENMFYVSSEQLHSPMAGNIAAFSSKDSAIKYSQSLAGELVTWEQIVKDND
jgi:copper chaperone NosL